MAHRNTQENGYHGYRHENRESKTNHRNYGLLRNGALRGEIYLARKTSTSGSAIVVAKAKAKATTMMKTNDPFLGSSAPMNLAIGMISKSRPTKSSSIPSTTNTDPERNWRNIAIGALTSKI